MQWAGCCSRSSPVSRPAMRSPPGVSWPQVDPRPDTHRHDHPLDGGGAADLPRNEPARARTTPMPGSSSLPASSRLGSISAYVYFSTSLPKGVMDSARVDGADRFALFTRIALPLAKPIIALVAFFELLAIWSNYFLAFVLPQRRPAHNLPVGLTALVSGSGALAVAVQRRAHQEAGGGACRHPGRLASTGDLPRRTALRALRHPVGRRKG